MRGRMSDYKDLAPARIQIESKILRKKAMYSPQEIRTILRHLAETAAGKGWVAVSDDFEPEAVTVTLEREAGE